MLLITMVLSIVMVAPGEIVITEIMYNPDGPTLGEDDLFEWVELCNRGTEPIQLDGMMLNDGSNQLFLGNFILEPMTRAVVPANESSFISAYGSGILIIPWDGIWTKLSNSADMLLLYSASGGVLDEIAYFDTWGVDEEISSRSAADGTGSSLEKISIGEENTETNWAPSIDYASPNVDPDTGDPVCWGTPGEVNSVE
ncbi:MAG: lamin tail domain-containing protein [Candidatus Aegiribacteria sp.]|nr:lamin tail domain-containing protein [Candidatus Aegiribacteria sp.]